MTQERYKLAKKIARGGMAEIYLGKHIGEDGFQRLCAIKRILPHYSQDQEFIQMFRDEAHICKRLQHANIVRVEGFEEVEGSYAIIMEYVDGSDLRTLLHASEQAKVRMSIPMACHIISEASRGLHYAHTKVDEITQQPLGIVHRDISPQNILVSFEGEVKVTDFGIADAESKLTETRPGIVKGKYSYMSPEQISAKAVDARTDVFALSIVLWEMLAMRRLFQGDNEVDTIQRVRNCKIEEELRQLNSEVDEDLDQIIKKGLAKDPKKRFKTAASFEKELRRYMSRKFPDFTPEDLGSYLKKVLNKKRAESAADIKRTLTETNLKAGRKTGKRRSVHLAFDQSHGSPNFSLARPAASTGQNRVASTPSQQRAFQRQSRTRTGLNHPVYTRGTGARRGPYVRKSKSHQKFLLLGMVAAAILAVGLTIVASFPAQTRPSQLVLRTQPSRVKLTIDNRPVNRGEYVWASSKRPVRLSLKPGRHILRAYREGYKTFQWEFELQSGERIIKDDIVLEEESSLAAVKIRMNPGDMPVRFNINDGYYIGTLIPKKVVAVAPDLLLGKTYTMRIYPNLKGKTSFLCSFTPKATKWRNPNVVTIDRSRKRCSMKGPGS